MANIERPIWSADGQTLSNVLVDNKSATYNITSTWYDGSPMDDSKLDNDLVYVKYDGEYLVRNLEEGQVLQKDTMNDMRNLSTFETLLLKMGIYKHVQLNGYYEKGDTPEPIDYHITSGSLSDNSFSVIVVKDIILTHNFQGFLNVLYAGLIPNNADVDNSPALQNIVNGASSTFRDGTIYFPKGLYYVKEGINIPAPREWTFEGDWSKNTGGNTGFSGILYNGTEATYVINVEGEASSSSRAKLNIITLFIRNLSEQTDVDGVVYNNGVAINLDTITISGFRDNLVIRGYFYYNRVNNCTFRSAHRHGIFATGSPLFNGTALTKCRIQNNGGWGFYSSSRLGEVITIEGCWIEGNGEGGIALRVPLSSNIVGNYFEFNEGTDIQITTRSSSGDANFITRISNNKFRPFAGNSVIRLNSATAGYYAEAIISNNIIETNSLEEGESATFISIPTHPNSVGVTLEANQIGSRSTPGGTIVLSNRTTLTHLKRFVAINDNIVEGTHPSIRGGTYYDNLTINGRLAVIPATMSDIDSIHSTLDIVFPEKATSMIRTRIGSGSETSGSHTTEFWRGSREVARIDHNLELFLIRKGVKGFGGSEPGVYFNINSPQGKIEAGVNSICLTPQGIYRKDSGTGTGGWVLFEPSAASADSASDVGATYSQAEVQAILTELRDLKTKMRASGLLAT